LLDILDRTSHTVDQLFLICTKEKKIKHNVDRL
jgi:hypothetical protein